MVQYPCGTCNKNAGSNSLDCVLCGMYHHLTVGCMPWHNKDQIAQIKELCKDSSCWSCGKCKVIMTKINARLGEVEKKVSGLTEEVEGVKTELAAAATERTEMKTKTASLEAKIDSNTNNVKAATMHEAEQRMKRRKNVVLYGVPESTAATPPDRISHDKQELNKVLEIVGASEGIKEDGSKRLTRVGQVKPGNPRPLRVELKKEDQRDELLEKSRILREDDQQPIRIKPDLTKMQQDQDKALRQEVDDLNKNKPQDDDGPFYWRIGGPPGELRKIKVKGAAPAQLRRGRPRFFTPRDLELDEQ